MNSFRNSMLDFFSNSISELSKIKFSKSEDPGGHLKTIDSLTSRLCQYYYDHERDLSNSNKSKIVGFFDGLNTLKEEILGVEKGEYANLHKKFNAGFLGVNGVKTVKRNSTEKTSREITSIKGIGPKYAAKLQNVGIHSVASLLKKCVDKKSIRFVSEQTGISASVLLKWINAVDLYKIRGVGSEYSALLEEAGVYSTKALGKKNSDDLHTKLVEINTQKKLVKQLPSSSKVADFVKQAVELNKIKNKK